MMNLRTYIRETFLSSLLDGQTALSIKPYAMEHIFFSILKSGSGAAGQDQKLEMMYRFQKIERYLRAVGRGEWHQASHIRRALEVEPFVGATALARSGMESLLCAALALERYLKQDHDTAARYLERSVQALRRMQAGGFDEACFAILEQQLNLLRVAVASDDADQALACVRLILAEISVSVGRLKLQHASDGACLSLSGHYHAAMLQKVFSGARPSIAQRFMDDLPALAALCPSDDIGRAYAILSLLRSGPPDAADSTALRLTQPQSLPVLLQIMLLKTCVERDGEPADFLGKIDALRGLSPAHRSLCDMHL